VTSPKATTTSAAAIDPMIGFLKPMSNLLLRTS
jgi:hypothetical protein